jgi:lipid-A-disaccharide synthase
MLKRVMIISGESSGELYGSLLAKTLKERNSSIEIAGVGGEVMESVGVNLISRISSAFGTVEAIKKYNEIRNTFKSVVSALISFEPQVLILIDYPDFNIRVAKEAKKLGIKILYYVSPQIWAWRKGRIKVIGRLVDMMAVILPFEEEIYRQAGIPCEFVGHPVVDEIREVISEVRGQKTEDRSLDISLDIEQEETKIKARKELGLIPDKPVMTLMPGSRTHEIKKLLPVMLEVMEEMKVRHPDYQFVIPVAPNLNESYPPSPPFEKGGMGGILLKGGEGGFAGCHFVKGQSIKALLASDIAVIASGTSTLQAALLGIPMVVVYKLSPLTYCIGRLIVKVKHIALVNVILDNSLKDEAGMRVRELLQKDVCKENIMKEISRIINDTEYRNNMLFQFQKVRGFFLDKNASLRVAEIAEEMSRF